MGSFIDLTGKRFGMLVVIERSRNMRDESGWLCRCDCGNEKVIASYPLRKGKTVSCDCRRRMVAPITGRFWGMVSIPDNRDGCWLWTGGKSKVGYGMIREGRRGTPLILAHRFSYELLVGPIPDGLLACHKCDVRNCVNPQHIFIGTHADNTADMMRKGRNRHGNGRRKAA